MARTRAAASKEDGTPSSSHGLPASDVLMFDTLQLLLEVGFTSVFCVIVAACMYVFARRAVLPAVMQRRGP
jgi:hypothetical protein